MIDAKIIADSLSPLGHRCITYVLTFPRIVLAEFNTHRALSRNSASSRAIPFKKMVRMVQENPFIPIKWMKEHTGMQGNEYFDNSPIIESNPNSESGKLLKNWLKARDFAVTQALELSRIGLTKQICNRLLEPFMLHTCICTATEWENFFALRAHPDAEIHIQDLAHKMLEAANNSEPTLLKEGEWHIPFGDKIDEARIAKLIVENNLLKESINSVKQKIATARCARVSYLNFEGKDDYLADIELFNRLLKAGHMSPFEHVAQVMSEEEYYNSLSGDFGVDWNRKCVVSDDFGWSGNFRGFIQLRKTLPNENKNDERYINKIDKYRSY